MEILHPRKAKEPKKIGRAPKYNLDYYMMMAKNVVEQGMSYREASKIYNVSHGSCSSLEECTGSVLPIYLGYDPVDVDVFIRRT